MHSSISNSDIQVAGGRWGATWLLALVLAAAVLGGLEWWWRAQGHVPSVEDDLALWSYQRQRVYDTRGKALVLTGASEIQTAFSPETFYRRFPDYRVVQLAVRGTNPTPTLWDLAGDERFRGIVLCAMNERWLAESSARGGQADYVRYHHDQSTLNTRLNRLLSAALEENFVVLNSALSLKSIAQTYRDTGHWPRPLIRSMNLDRSRQVDFGQIDKEMVRLKRDRKMERFGQMFDEWALSPEVWLQEALRIEPAIQQIHRRGGKVIFLRFPLGPEGEALLEKAVPRARCWNAFAARTQAITIHYQDVPALGGFDLPDGAHLDYHDAAHFTVALVDELVRRKVFDRAADVNAPRP